MTQPYDVVAAVKIGSAVAFVRGDLMKDGRCTEWSYVGGFDFRVIERGLSRREGGVGSGSTVRRWRCWSIRSRRDIGGGVRHGGRTCQRCIRYIVPAIYTAAYPEMFFRWYTRRAMPG